MTIQNVLVRLFIVVFFFTLTACSSPEEKKEQHYLKAMEYIEKEDIQAAIIELKNAIQVDAKYADARYQLGLLYLKEKNGKAAFNELIRAADLDHENLDANLKAAELYLITRKKEESRKLVERILIKDPHHQEALALLANLELIAGNFDDASKALDTIGDEVEKSDKLMNIRGRIYGAKEQWPEAEASFKKAIEINKERYANYNALLIFYQSRKETEKAKELLFEMVERFPDNPQNYLLLAGYYRASGNKEQEEATLKKVVEVAPRSPRYRLLLAGFYKNNGDAEKTEETLIEARSTIEGNADLGSALATHYFDTKQFDKAQTILAETLALKADHQGGQLLKARFLMKDRQMNDAIERLEKLTTDFPRWSEPFFYLGVARLAAGEIDLAQHAVAAAIKANGRDAKYHTLMAQLFQIQGAFEDAKKEAAIALNLNKKNLQAALILTDAMIGLKEFDNAQQMLTGINEQIKDNPEIIGRLAIATLGNNDSANTVKLLNRLLALSPGNNRAVLLLLALTYKDDIVGGEAFIREQISKAPENSGLQLILGDALLKQKKDEEALAAFEKAIDLNQNNIKAYIAAGRLMVKLGRKDEAMAKYQAMIAQNPKWIQGYMGIAALHESAGNTTEAMRQYRKVLEIKPDEAHIADTLGWIHYKRGSYTLAIPQFEMALNSRPDDPAIQYHLALALKGNGNYQKAGIVLRELLEKGKDFPEKGEAVQLLEEVTKQQ
ncbi:MAG: hypothetical protein CSA26_06640 [Desulfobacterales bacterium]|nr:MAG: hypothetical protein CSA26_06640 [Desulfobacterales bacterium]